MRFRQPEEDKKDWVPIGMRLCTVIPITNWPEAPWLRKVISDNHDEPGRVQAYKITEEPHVELLESAVRQWLSDGTVPTLPHPVSYLLAIRFSIVGNLLSTFTGILTAPPQAEIPALYESFLIEWWRKHGAYYAVGDTCADDDILQ